MGDVEWAFEDSKRYPYSVDYNVGKDLGEGKFSVVKYATHKKTGEEVAIKCIDRVNTNPDELVHEAMLVQLVEEHPGIIKIKDVYEDRKYYYLVMEFVSGGELFDKIVESDNYSEKEAAQVIRQICDIVAFIHDKGVVHRDLKPENLLCKDKTGTDLKLCDFGLGDTIEDDELLTAIVGSTTYMAPEVDKGIGYDKSVDMYSIGVILYILLCGYPPFEPDSGIIELEFPKKARANFILEWSQISPVAIQIIKKLLSPVPSERYTANELLRHSWIRGESVSTRKLVGTIRNVKNFNTARRSGHTVRTKDPVTKATVFNVFDEHGNITPRGKTSPHVQPVVKQPSGNQGTTVSSTTVPKEPELSPVKEDSKKPKPKKDKSDKTKSKGKRKEKGKSKKAIIFATTEKPKSRVGFVDDPHNEKMNNSENGAIDYKDRYEKLMKELETSKKEISDLKDQISRLEKSKSSKSPKKSKTKK